MQFKRKPPQNNVSLSLFLVFHSFFQVKITLLPVDLKKYINLFYFIGVEGKLSDRYLEIFPPLC